jgi:hypothetical protein
MGFAEVLTDTLFAALWFSWVALLIAALPPAGVALILKGRGSRWTIPANEKVGERKIHYVTLGLLGGLAGEISAICSLSFGEWWVCRTEHQLCNDGQGGMALIFTIPALSLFGSIITLLWTWASLRIPADMPWASVFSYSGTRRSLNWICAIAIQLIFWSLLTFAVFRLTVM